MESSRDFSPPDLVSSSFGARQSLLVLPDHLLVLRHGYTKDRIERITFDRVAHTTLRSAFPVARLLGWGLPWALVLVVTLLIATTSREPALLAGILFPVVFLGACLVRAMLLRNIEFTFSRGGELRRVSLYASAKKARAAYDKMTEAIHREQDRLANL